MRGGAYGTQSASSSVNVGTTTNASLTSEQIVALLGYGSGCPTVPTPVAPTPVAPTPVAPTPVAPTPVAPTPVAPTPTAPVPTPGGGCVPGELCYSEFDGSCISIWTYNSSCGCVFSSRVC